MARQFDNVRLASSVWALAMSAARLDAMVDDEKCSLFNVQLGIAVLRSDNPDTGKSTGGQAADGRCRSLSVSTEADGS